MFFTVLITLVAVSLAYLCYLLNPFPRGYRKPTRKPFERKPPVSFSGRTIPCHNPGNGEYLGEDVSATPEELDECIRRAQEAQKDWGTTSFEEREAFLYDLLQYLVDHQEEICKLSVADTGKTMMEAYYGEIVTSCEKLRHLITYGRKALSPEQRSVPLLLFLKKARVEYYPLGVIGIIIPWNYPFHNALSAIASAVFAGNAAVVKVSEWATFSRTKFQDIFQSLLAQRGYNPDLIQLIPGYGDTGAALCKNTRVDKILFIGSPVTGQRVMEAASKNMTPVILELGGKDPFIVLKDAEIDHAVEVALRGSFINQGQNCIASERIFVEEPIYQEFCDKVVAIASKLRVGCPLRSMDMTDETTIDCGAMTMPAQVEKVAHLVEDAISKGARALVGGKRIAALEGENKVFYPPTVLVDVDDSMKIVQEEVFGPVMMIRSFKTEEEVLRLANGTEFGLGSSVFARDYKRAEAIAKQIEAGMTTINDFGVGYLVQSLPFGGCKKSGFGRFNGEEGLREFSRLKSVVTDRFPVRTKPPRFTSYPIPSSAPYAVSSGVTMLYSGSLSKKIAAGIKLVQVLLTTKEPKL